MILPRYSLSLSVLTLFLTISPLFSQAEKPKEQPKATDPATPKDAPTYVNANLKLKDVNLPELLKKVNVEVPIKLEGTVSLNVKAEIPISGDTSIKNYRINGALTSEKFVFENMTLLNFKAEVVFRDGLLTLTELSGTIDAPQKPGTFNGTASFGVEPRTELKANLKLDSIPLDEIVKAAPSLKGLATGRLSGEATVQAPADKLGDPAAFIATATITSEELTGLGRKAKNLTVNIDVKDGIATLTKASANVEGLPIQGNGTLKLTDKYAFDATILTEPSDTAAITNIVPEAGLPFELTGKFDTTTKVTGTLEPLTYELGGKFNAQNLNVGKALINKISTDWALNQNQISLKNIDAVVKDGTIQGDATVPLGDKGDGLNANLTINNLDLDELAKASPDYAGLAGGILSGKINVQAPADKLTTPGAYTGSANLTSPKITAYKRHARNVEIVIDVKEGMATLIKAVGNVEGLPLAVAGKMKLSDKFDFAANIVTQPSDTATITKIIPEVELPFDLTGKFDTNTKVTGTLEPLAYDLSGKFNGENLGIGQAEINKISTDYALTESQITLKNIDAVIKDGTLKGDAAVPLSKQGKDFNLNLTFDKLSLDELVKASPEYAGLAGGVISGKVDLQAPPGKFTTPAAYSGNINITAPQLTAYKRSAKNVEIVIDVKDGKATLSRAVGNVEGLPLTVDGTMTLSDKFPFNANIVTKPSDTATITKLVPEVEIPFDLSGKFDTNTKVTGTLEPLAYDLSGKFNAENLSLGEATINKISTDYALSESQITLKNIDAVIKDGTLKGDAAVPLSDDGEVLNVNLKLDKLSLDELVKASPEYTGLAGGIVSGTVDVQAPADKFMTPSAYTGSVKLTAPQLTVYNRNAKNVDLNIDIKDGMATMSKAVAKIEGLPLAMAGRMMLSGQYNFAVNIVTEPTDTAAIQKIVPEAGIPFELTGKFDTNTKITGTLEPLTYDLNGKLNAQNLNVGTATIDRISTDYALTEKQLTLKGLDAEVYKGTIKGDATVPLAEGSAGEFNVVFKDVNSATITKSVPSLPIKLSGEISGTLKGTIPDANAKGERPIKADLDLSAPKLIVQGIPTDKLEGAINYQPDHILYKLKGQTLGGSFDLDGDFPLDKLQEKNPDEKAAPVKEKADPDDEKKYDGSLKIDNIDLSVLSRVLRTDSLKPLKGRVRALINYNHDPETGIPVGSGIIQIQGPGWGEFGSGTRVLTDIRFSPEAIILEDLHGYFSEGSVRAQVVYNLKDPDRSYYTFRISGLNTMKILKPLGYDTLGGQLSMTGRGRLGRFMGGNGTLTFRRAKVAGLNMADMKASYSWSYTNQGSAQVHLRDVSGRIFGGRVRGKFDLSYSRTATLKGDIRFVDVSFRSLLGKGGASGYGGSRMNGQAKISGRNVRSVNDITGLLTAEIGPGPVFDLPVFTQLARVALPTLSGKAINEFDKGAVIARLANSIVKIERFSLEGQASSVFIDGTVGLNGRLDLDAIVATGNLALNSSLLSRIGVRIPAIGPIPVATIIKVAQFLSDRTVRANITGTTSNPRVQINFAALFTEEAIRFFTNTLSPVPIPMP